MTQKQSPITVMGSLIRQHRQQKQLSQMDLARGICSQGTISQIENRNVSPSLKIVDLICQRLDLTFEMVFRRPLVATDRLSKVENDILFHRYEQAEQRLKSISDYQLDSGWDKGRYAFYLGLLELHLHSNYQKAVQYFWNVIECPQHKKSIYRAWANVASKLAFFKMGPDAIASDVDVKVDDSLTILKQLHSEDFSLRLLTRPYIDIMLLHTYTRNYSAVVKIGNRIQTYLITRNSMCNLSMINLLIGQAILAQKNVKLALQHFNYAKTLSSLCSDHDIFKLADKEIKNLLDQKKPFLPE